MSIDNFLKRKNKSFLSKAKTRIPKLYKIKKRIGDIMSYEIIFNDMIDSLRMAELKLYEYTIVKEKEQKASPIIDK